MEERVTLSSPEIVRAKKHEELSGTRFQLACAKRFPDIEIGVGAGKERGLIENRNTLEWRIQIPLPLFNRNQGEVLESEILIVKAKREYEDALNTMRLQTKQILSAFENSLNQVRTYSKKVLPQAERSLALTLEGYNAGKFTSIDLLEAQRTLVETREIFVHLLQELNDNAIEIERMTGVSIEELQ